MRLYVRGVGAMITLTTLHPWSTVKDTKDTLQDLLKIPGPRQRLVFRGEELKSNNRRLLEWDVTEGSTLLLMFHGPKELENPIRPLYSGTEPPGFSTLVEQAKQGIAKGLIGKLTIDGTGGTYFLRNAQKQEVLVFKPADEEAFGPNNPRGHTGRMGQQSFRPGVLSGEGHLREIAAYLLDHNEFAGVPKTARMEVACRVLGNSAMASPFQESKKAGIRTKVGSMQAFVSSDDVAANFSQSLFPVHEVHKIAILDIRLVNTDRNDANILVVNRANPSHGAKHLFLVPIDHAFCLPDTLEIAWTDWAWLGWPQAKRPLDEATKEYVRNLDIERDIEMLRNQLVIREPCLRLMRITHMLLQRAIARGCSLFQIGSIICRKEIEEPSLLEVICHQATAFSLAIARQAPNRPLSRKSEGKDKGVSLLQPPLAPPNDLALSLKSSDPSPTEISKHVRSPSFPPPSPSSWANSSPLWSRPVSRSRTSARRAHLSSIDEDDVVELWNSLPLLPTRRSNSSPALIPSSGSPVALGRTASTPRSLGFKRKAKKPPLIPALPSSEFTSDGRPPSFPSHSSRPSTPSPVASIPKFVAPLSLLSRVPQQNVVPCQTSPGGTVTTSSFLPNVESSSSKGQSLSPVGSASPSAFTSFPTIPSPASFTSFPILSPSSVLPSSPSPNLMLGTPTSSSACFTSTAAPSFASFPSAKSLKSLLIPLPSISPVEPNPSRHGVNLPPELLATFSFSPRKQPPAVVAEQPRNESFGNPDLLFNSNGKVSIKETSGAKYEQTGSISINSSYGKFNPRNGNLKILSCSPKLKTSLCEDDELSNNDVKIKVIGDNPQRATKLSTSISGTLRKIGNRLENTEKIIRDTTTVVTKHIAAVSDFPLITDTANRDLSFPEWNNRNENLYYKNPKPTSDSGFSALKPNLEHGASSERREKLGDEPHYLWCGPVPLFSAKRRSGAKSEGEVGGSDDLRKNSSGEATVCIEHGAKSAEKKSSPVRLIPRRLDYNHELEHDKENGNRDNLIVNTGNTSSTKSMELEAILSNQGGVREQERISSEQVPLPSAAVAPTHVPVVDFPLPLPSTSEPRFPTSATGVGLPLGLDRPLELKRAMSYSFSVNVHPTGFAAGSKSPTRPTSKSVDHDDWSLPPSSASGDASSNVSTSGALDELFFSCLAKLIDTMLDFTSTKHGQAY